MEKAVIDRFEGNIAVLLIGDGNRRFEILRKQLPKGVRAGIWLKVELDGDTLTHAEIDLEETERAKQRIAEKLERLRKGLHRDT